MQKILFFIYTIIKSDNRYKATSNTPVYATIFLISFFELVFFLPLILFLNDIFFVVNLKKYLSLHIGLRYLLIFGSISLLFFMNFYLFFNGNKLENITKKIEYKKDRYLRHKWLLVLFVVVLGFIVLVALRLLHNIKIR